jgi:hypothetical protein
LLWKRRKLGQKAANGGVAFENPSYLREMNVEQVQVSSTVAPHMVFWIYSKKISALQIPAVSAHTATTNTDWRQEILQTPNGTETTNSVPMATEVNPSLYEELKLGPDRAGFKRLVW